MNYFHKIMAQVVCFWCPDCWCIYQFPISNPNRVTFLEAQRVSPHIVPSLFLSWGHLLNVIPWLCSLSSVVQWLLLTGNFCLWLWWDCPQWRSEPHLPTSFTVCCVSLACDVTTCSYHTGSQALLCSHKYHLFWIVVTWETTSFSLTDECAL